MDSALLSAALDYAARGLAVFPCAPKDKRPLVKSEAAKQGGFKLASIDADTIRAWWKRWPKAMIGLPLASVGARAFVLDLDIGDPPVITGAAYLARLIRWLKDELGEALPPDLPIVETGSGGYHLWLAAPLGSAAIGNRANLIKALVIEQPEGVEGKVAHVDVRGQTGYVIVPPSVRADGRSYAFAQGDLDHGLPVCPPKILALIAKEERESGAQSSASRGETKPAPNIDDAVRRYALAALDKEIRRVAGAQPGTRNETLNEAAFKLGQLVGAGALSEMMAVVGLDDVVSHWPDIPKSQDTIRRGVADGKTQPRDLRPIRQEAERRASRRRGGSTLRPVAGGRDAAQGSAATSARGSAARRPSERREKTSLPDPASAPPRQLEMREILREQRKRVDPPAIEKRGGAPPGRWTPDVLGLPEEDPCPVIPLGIDGRKYFFLDSAGQDTAIAASSLNQAGIQDLFAATPNWPEWACPRWGKKKVPDPDTGELKETLVVASHQGDDVRKMLFRACARKGHFDADHKIRGRGAWRRFDGALLYHAGEELWIVDGPAGGGRIRALETGLLHEGSQEFVYPRRPSLPAPWSKPVVAADNPARALIEGFRNWNWDRPDIAPVLLLGSIGAGYLGGALDWRPPVALIGDYGTGKSTLQKAMKLIFGEALLDSVNATAASIYGSLRHDTRPVALDEFEGKQDPRREQAIIELARQAASGGVGRRGTSDASGGVEFEIRSVFTFAFINTPPLLPQDLSRMALLRLQELPKQILDEKGERRDQPIVIDADSCGRMLLARMMLEWHRFDATLDAYKRVLMTEGGHSTRGADTYGTLLACADLMLGPELADQLGIPMVDDLAPWGALLHVDTLPEVEDATRNWKSCIHHMLQSRVEVWRSGERATVGQLLEDFLAGDSEHVNEKYVKRQLAQAGLGLVYETTRGWCLAVPQQSPLLQRLFYGSRWQGVPDAGGWSEALRQAPPDAVWRGREAPRPRINGVQDRCALIVLSTLGLGAPAPAPAPKGGR